MKLVRVAQVPCSDSSTDGACRRLKDSGRESDDVKVGGAGAAVDLLVWTIKFAGVKTIPTTRNESLPQGTSNSGLCWWGKVDNYCSFVRLENQVQHGWDLLGHGFGWGGIEHAISDSDEGREKSDNNSWQDIGFLAESMNLLLEGYER
jgi:hypothetical protein